MIDYTQLPVTTTDPDVAFARDGQTRRQADVLEIVMGLRAMVKGELPKAKPACPTVVGTTLPRHTREDALRQETANHAQRFERRNRLSANAEELAAAEFGWFNHVPLAQQMEGHQRRTECLYQEHQKADASWMQQLAYDELVSWLRLEAKLTDKEVEALELRANGLPVPDRHCLKRAQQRAQAALAC